MKYSHLSVAVPLLAEYDNLPSLMAMLERQSVCCFSLYLCVNNLEGWASSDNPAEKVSYSDNQASLQYLLEAEQRDLPFDITVIDCSSLGRGWTGKRRGVGWARKTLFDAIAEKSGNDELIVSLDADTAIGENYLATVLDVMNACPNHSALAVPYYHPLGNDDDANRSMLRYEIYMRHYLMSFILNAIPYAFTALGSAMVFPLWAYRRVGGITPLQGGEDFYLMQKFAKTGSILTFCPETVYPSCRPSLRVPFGTGPAIAKGMEHIDSVYPLYPFEGFEAVGKTVVLFPQLYLNEVETPMSPFLRSQLKTDNLWQPLRKNFKEQSLFVHACQERVDGLRILQFLKTFPLRRAEEELSLFCQKIGITIPDNFSFRTSEIEEIDTLRNFLYKKEMEFRRFYSAGN